MSDKIMERDVQTGIEQAWHGKTNVVKCITRENSGIVYPMEKRPLYLGFEEDNGERTFNEAGFFTIVSMDDKLPIGNPVGEDYNLISNSDIFDLIENSLGGTKHVIVSAGSVENRSKVFVSAKLDDSVIKAAGRETENVLNFMFGHGGKMGVTIRTGITVIVCANTLNMALSRRGELNLNIKHTKNSAQKIPNIEKAIDAHIGVTAEFKRAMDEVAGIKATEADARKIFAGFIGRDQSGKPVDELSTRAENTIERLAELFNKGKGNNGDDMADVFNAFTDYYSHESSGGSDRWKQFVSSEYGSAGRDKQEAYSLITDPVSLNDERRKLGVKNLQSIKRIGSSLLAMN